MAADNAKHSRIYPTLLCRRRLQLLSGRQALQEKAPVIYRTQFHQLVAGGAIPEGQYKQATEIKDLAQKAGEDVKAKTQEFANELQGDVKNKPAQGTSVSDWKEKLRKKNEEKKVADQQDDG
ncbi:hypothetical protein DID88_006756 [Monilinia fructigena]|uniref:Uncharacterized protein n=1 Tax=Monilinia fructigena TaxID=38457 RepID=A0A395IFW5_9HELO|nr:hypothetical protein DID88_006756 [Monilinia fructigena]